jgi:hypothetical protein
MLMRPKFEIEVNGERTAAVADCSLKRYATILATSLIFIGSCFAI